MNLLTKTLAVGMVLTLAIQAQAATIVEWGATGFPTTPSQTDIVTANQGLSPNFPNLNLDLGTDNQPTNADYYASPANMGKSPIFSAAASARIKADGTYATLPTRQIQNNNNGDRLRLSSNNPQGAEYVSGMVVWQSSNFLTADNSLETLTLEAFRANGNAATMTGSTRFVVQKTGGSWYASEPNNLGGGFTSVGGSAPAMSWFNFTPHTAGVATVGGAAAIDMNDVKSVGYFFESEDTAATPLSLGIFARHFQATANTVPEPSSMSMLAIFGLAWFLRRRR